MVAVPGNGAKKLDTRKVYSAFTLNMAFDCKRTISCSIVGIESTGTVINSKQHFINYSNPKNN